MYQQTFINPGGGSIARFVIVEIPILTAFHQLSQTRMPPMTETDTEPTAVNKYRYPENIHHDISSQRESIELIQFQINM